MPVIYSSIASLALLINSGPTLSDLRDFSVAGERPSVIIYLARDAEPEKSGTALLASVQWKIADDEKSTVPIWSMVRIDWSGEKIKTSAVADETSCPMLPAVLSRVGETPLVEFGIRTITSSRLDPAIRPPQTVLHRYASIWAQVPQIGSSSNDAEVQYTAWGGPIFLLTVNTIENLNECFLR